MRYEILGPVRIAQGHDFLSIKARKIEAVLAVLLIRVDTIVSIDQLVAEIWGTDPPRRATACLHVYISQLRKWLAGSTCTVAPVVTRQPGYLLRLGADELDVDTFVDLSRQGRKLAAADRHPEAVTAFESALALCRGPILADLPHGPIVEGFATWLREAELECTEMLMDAYLTLGRHRELVGRLGRLTVEHPLREIFYRQHMLALYRSERQAEALGVYRNAGATLRDELGLEPGVALRELQRAILVHDDRLSLVSCA